MKKNLFDVTVKDELIERLSRLTPDSQPAWGSMTPVEMLRHCSEAIYSTLTSRPSDVPTTFKQKMRKFFIIHFIPRIPKGAKAPKHINMALHPFMLETFEKELDNFTKAIATFQNHRTPITNKHPYFGTMSNKEWGIVSWMHMDHHLRQFGV